jgi:transposase
MADEQREFLDLCRTLSRSNFAHWRYRGHKIAGIKEAIERAGATLRYLPAYSPDLNPIEQAFAKLKAALRKAAARTFDALVEAIANALTRFTPQECANYIANSGYRQQS